MLGIVLNKIEHFYFEYSLVNASTLLYFYLHMYVVRLIQIVAFQMSSNQIN